MFERSEFGCRAALGSGAQGTGDGFIVAGAASVADGFGYFCLNKSDPRVSAEASDLKEEPKKKIRSRPLEHAPKANIHGFPPTRNDDMNV